MIFDESGVFPHRQGESTITRTAATHRPRGVIEIGTRDLTYDSTHLTECAAIVASDGRGESATSSIGRVDAQPR